MKKFQQGYAVHFSSINSHNFQYYLDGQFALWSWNATERVLRLRVKDIDFQQNQITVRRGTGDKDRVTMLPLSLKESLREHLKKVKQVNEVD